MSGLVALTVAVLAGFLAGSIPVGLILLRLRGKPDPRSVGSGNIGATNVTRAGGRGLGAVTLALDAAKALVPALLFAQISPEAAAAAGAGAIAGHCFPPWLGFAGGKGVSCQLGASFALGFWLAPAAFAASWVLGVAVTRRVSIGSLAASWIAPVAAWIGDAGAAATVALLVGAMLVSVRHRSNIRRLVAGLEPAVGGPREEPVPGDRDESKT